MHFDLGAKVERQAYTLAMTLQTPINGRVSDIVGRKPMVRALSRTWE